jgi:hypothetical protein
MYDPFDRRFNCGAVALVMGRLKNGGKTSAQVDSFVEELIRENNLFNNAPFLWVLLIHRLGIKNDLKITFKRINKKYGDLGVSLELDMDILKWADQRNLDLLQDIFMVAALEALIQVAHKYKLPNALFIQERARYNNIPNTIEECEALEGKSLLKASGD